MFVDQALVRAEASLFIVNELLKTTIYQFHAQILPKTGRRRSGVNHLPLMILGRMTALVYFKPTTRRGLRVKALLSRTTRGM